MKLVYLMAASALLFSCLATANELPTKTNQLAIQGAIATGGSLGIGITNYTETTELGGTISGIIDNADDQTKLVVPVVFAGWRKLLSEGTYTDGTYFAYGLDLVGKFGHIDGERLDADYQIGPYISLEQLVTKHILLVGWIQPYSYEYVKKEGEITSINGFFACGGMGISYLF